ncbi:hypothetical protein WA026_019687 [Henosepilachna vigintioctopunctata]|uniref:Uncharacterized protein n=1 Tax=Henosepilachna vigintioctopunctata TaxID=420089 RepID=A0AAW1UHQ3_9CUCU
MSSFCLVTRLVLLFSVIICMECAIANKPIRNKHAHNMIHKEDKSSNGTIVDESDEDSVKSVTSIDHPNTSTPEDDIVESANRRRTSLKITIPLHHQQEKQLSSIKHPLPKGMHDIMPHEHSHQGIMNQHKVHHDFLIHEGPKLQRRLHHHFTLEEIRQRRKELRENYKPNARRCLM